MSCKLGRSCGTCVSNAVRMTRRCSGVVPQQPPMMVAPQSRAKRAAVIDQVAAGYILQGALDRLGFMERQG